LIFAFVEVLILPFAAQTWLAHEPLVAGALMGLALVRKGHRGTLCFLEAGQVAECLSGRTKTGTVPFADS
jgi:hypothetical protein